MMKTELLMLVKENKFAHKYTVAVIVDVKKLFQEAVENYKISKLEKCFRVCSEKRKSYIQISCLSRT